MAKVRNPHVRPDTRSQVVQELFDLIEASGMTYAEIEKKLDWPSRGVETTFRGKQLKLLKIQAIAKVLGYEIVFWDRAEKKDEW